MAEIKGSFPRWIAECGDELVAKALGSTVRSVAAYRRRERIPSPEIAQRVIDLSGGRVTWEGIFSPSVRPAWIYKQDAPA